MITSSSPNNFPTAAPLSCLRQRHAVVNMPLVSQRVGNATYKALSVQSRDPVRFSGRIPQVINYGYWWAEHQQWFPKQKMRIATALEAGTNRLRSWLALAMMALPTMVPVPNWLLQKISRDYFYSPRKVFNPLKFQAGGLNELNSEILSNSFQVQPHTSNLSTIHSFYLKAKGDNPTIVFSHGRDTNIGQLEGLFKGAKDKKYGFFAYDYPGFGRSEGHPDEQGLEDAGIAACRFLASEADYGGGGYGVPYKDQIIMGYSLGGAVAVKVANKFATEPQHFALKGHQPKGLILVNTFTDIQELFTVKSKQLHRKVAQWSDPSRTGLKFDSDKKIAKVTMPVMVFHCKKDKTIPWQQGDALHQAAIAAKAKKFVRIDDSTGHRFNSAGQCSDVIGLADKFFKSIQTE